HGDEVDAERLLRALARRRDLGIELHRLHRAAGDDAETAAIRDRRDKIALADPGHGTAHDRKLATEEFGAAPPQVIEKAARGIIRASSGRHRGANCAARLDARRHTSKP